MYDINEQIVTYKAGLTRLLGYYELQYSIGQTGILAQDSTHWTMYVLAWNPEQMHRLSLASLFYYPPHHHE